MPIVLDASVILKWFFEEKDRDKALLLRNQHIEGDVKIILPEFAIYEIIHALRFSKHQPSNYLIRRAISTLLALGIKRITFDNELLVKAVDVSFQTDISVYDAYYVTVALDTKCPFITADQRLVRKLEGLTRKPSGFSVIHLEEYS